MVAVFVGGKVRDGLFPLSPVRLKFRHLALPSFPCEERLFWFLRFQQENALETVKIKVKLIHRESLSLLSFGCLLGVTPTTTL